jgi:hypothetical protein
MWQTDGDGSLAVSPTIGSFDEGCPTLLWGSVCMWTVALYAVDTAHKAVTHVDAVFHHSAQSPTTPDEDVPPAFGCDPVNTTGHVQPLGTTDWFRSGLSQSLRRRKQCRPWVRRVRGSSEEPIVYRATACAAVLGLSISLTLVVTGNLWACTSAIFGVYLLATNQHFQRPVCAALSLNIWCAVAWIAWVMSPEIGAAVAAMAVAVRRSGMLFPSPAGALHDPQNSLSSTAAGEASDACAAVTESMAEGNHGSIAAEMVGGEEAVASVESSPPVGCARAVKRRRVSATPPIMSEPIKMPFPSVWSNVNNLVLPKMDVVQLRDVFKRVGYPTEKRILDFDI